MGIQDREAFQTLFAYLSEAIEDFPDVRTGENTLYSLQDISRAAFSVFFMQSPSFLAHQNLMQQAHGVNNGKTLFGMKTIPSDVQIRNLLDPVAPAYLRPVFKDVTGYLKENGVIDKFRSFHNTLLIALDGTGYFSSESIRCPSCSAAHHKDGRTTYTHTALMSAIVKPGCPQVIPLEPEFITPQYGHEKQDCEIQAAKRWFQRIAPAYGTLGVTVLGDDIYACQPIIEEVLKQDLDFIFVSKSRSHKYLQEELESLEKLGQMNIFQHTLWSGKKRYTYTYRFVNDVALKDSDDSLMVNWVELCVTDEKAAIRFCNSFITSYSISDENVTELVEAGRCRWKIENETFNNLKTKGYHFEHNFGHGKLYLSQTLLSMNILAFLFHTVLELLDEKCLTLRKALPRRDTFFQHIATLTQYLCFASWQTLLAFMIRSIREGPSPPPDPAVIIT